MKTDTKIILGVSLLTAAVIAFIFVTANTALKANRSILERDGIPLGNEVAPHVLVEFSDFLCPACKAADPVVTGILDHNPGKIRIIYRHFPLPKHPLAAKAARAAEAASKQGKFRDYAEELFQNQENLKETSFVEIAKKLNLDTDQFQKDFNSEEVSKRIQRDIADAQSVKIVATPTFFLDGGKLNFTSPETLQKAIVSKL